MYRSNQELDKWAFQQAAYLMLNHIKQTSATLPAMERIALSRCYQHLIDKSNEE